jgi:class 3 adenylate cyclase
VSHEALEFAAMTAALIALGLSVIMVVGVEHTRPNGLLAAATLVAALAIGTLPPYVHRVDRDQPDLLARLQGLFEVGAIVLYGMYLLAILASSTVSGRRARIVRCCAWTIVALAGWHAVASFAWPVQRLNDYELGSGQAGALSRPGFWLFAGFWLVAAVPFGIGWGLLAFGGQIDQAESRRAQSAVWASALLIAATAAPPVAFPVLLAGWISLFMYGQLQYVSAAARRGVFLSRFLSPRVAELVAARGLAEATKPHLADITVVCADLRGFTSYSASVPSQTVVDLLADYYDAVGAVVAQHRGTITNYAGDGVLILIGAPIADARHAATGIQVAQEILVAVDPVLTRWRTAAQTLGLGVGVACGTVTVGAISAETRMEYTAVGTPVNLAARLCSAASAGEVLIDANAARLSHAANARNRGEMQFKGFAHPQQIFAVGGTAP